MPSCHSTNEIASELVRHTDKSEGLIVITDEQKKGRGQRGNHWESAAGKNLTFSLLLKPSFLQVDEQFLLNMITSLAVAEVVARHGSAESIHVKWPNDVLIKKKKVCGILIENSLVGKRIGHSIVGIGLNINQSTFASPNATALIDLIKKESYLPDILHELVVAIERFYLLLKQGKAALIKEQYLNTLYGFMENVPLFTDHEFEGSIVDVMKDGRLIVAHERTRSSFDFKELKFILP